MKTRVKGLIVFIIFCFILLFFSTPAVLCLTGNTLTKQVIDTEIVSQDVNWSISSISEPKGLMGMVLFNGWAFDKTAPKKVGRQVSLILKSDESAYEIVSEMFDTPDIVVHFKDLDLATEDIGFSGSFSTIPLPDGKYELFIKYSDERERPVIVYTGRYFVKGGRSFEKLPKD